MNDKSSKQCAHSSVKRDTHGWRCDECLRTFFPSGDTGAEQETVRIREALRKLVGAVDCCLVGKEYGRLDDARAVARKMLVGSRDETTAAVEPTPHKYATHGPCHICGGQPGDAIHAEKASGPQPGDVLGTARMVYAGKLPPRKLDDRTSNLVSRLRIAADIAIHGIAPPPLSLLSEAAAEIEQVRTENDRLQDSINRCSTEEGLRYANELQRLQLLDCERLLAAHDPKKECGYWLRSSPVETKACACAGAWHIPKITCTACGTSLKQCPECRVIAGHRNDCSAVEPDLTQTRGSIPDELTLPQLIAGQQALLCCCEDPDFDAVRAVITAVKGAS